MGTTLHQAIQSLTDQTNNAACQLLDQRQHLDDQRASVEEQRLLAIGRSQGYRELLQLLERAPGGAEALAVDLEAAPDAPAEEKE